MSDGAVSVNYAYTPVQFLGREVPLLPTPVFSGFPEEAQMVKNPPAMQETWV